MGMGPPTATPQALTSCFCLSHLRNGALVQSPGKPPQRPPSYAFATQLPTVILSATKNQVWCYSVCGYRSRLSTGISVPKLILRFAQNDRHNLGSPNPDFASVL